MACLLQIYITDPDTAAGNLTLTVNNPRFTFDNWTLCTNAKLDAEESRTYNLTIFVSDGVSSHTKSQTFYVHITDVNDNTPEFNRTDYDTVIPQNAESGYYITTIGATDADISNDGFTFFLSNGDGNFVIDSVTGNLTIASYHNRLCINCTYSLTINVMDYGEPPKSNVMQIVIYIDTTNHFPPVFSQSIYNVSVTEKTEYHDTIVTVSATDQDCPDGITCVQAGSVLYRIVTGSADKFTINSSTGDIYLHGLLDYRNRSYYDLVVEAKDKAEDFKTDQTHVYVWVTDKNESPQFVHTNSTICSVENVTTGGLVGIVTAVDPDASARFTNLTYTLLDHNDLFRVDATTGNVYASKNLTTADIQNIDLHFIVTDLGGLNDTTSLQLSNGKKGNPVFERSSSIIHVSIKEDIQPPVIIADVNTTTEVDGTITYRLVPDSTHFDIDNTTVCVLSKK